MIFWEYFSGDLIHICKFSEICGAHYALDMERVSIKELLEEDVGENYFQFFTIVGKLVPEGATCWHGQ